MYHRHVVASIDADVQQSWVHSVGNYESGSRSETAGQQGVRNANVSPRNCLPRNVARKKTSAGRDIETRHALRTHPPTNSCDWGGKSRWLVPASFIKLVVVLFSFSSFPSFRRGVSRRGEILVIDDSQGQRRDSWWFFEGSNNSLLRRFVRDRSGN